MHPLGGHIGSEGDGLGPKQPELFDIHVMLFAGDPETTVAGLERFFSIDREAAERLVTDVPVVVKRAAEPDIAAEMVDVLNELGAQVVLLPAACAVPSETDILDFKTPTEPPPADDADGALELEDMHAQRSPAWGALESERVRAHAPPRERAAERKREPARHRGATADLLADAPMAELDLAAPTRSDEPNATWGGSAPVRGGAAQRAARGATSTTARSAPRRLESSSLPPALDAETDEGLVIAPLYEPPERTRIERAAPAPIPAPAQSVAPDLGLGSVPPLPDLGLGAVPPLPSMERERERAPAIAGMPPIPGEVGKGKLRVPPPPPAPATLLAMTLPRSSLHPAPHARRGPPAVLGAPAPAPAQQRSFYERTIEADEALKLPSLSAAQTSEPRAAQTKPAADGYWSGRRAASGADANETGGLGEPAAAPPTASANHTSHEPPSAPQARSAQAKSGGGATSASKESRGARVGGQTLIEIIAGLAVFAFGIQQDSSILFGNASLVMTLMHGAALYAIGAGLLELRS